jgi:hypothetical protein
MLQKDICISFGIPRDFKRVASFVGKTMAEYITVSQRFFE